MNFMEVMQDLLTLQLEHQEAKTHNLAMLYGQQPCLLMITSSEDGDDSVEFADSTPSVLPRGLRPPILSGITAQTMRRNPWYYDAEQLADQEAYDLLHPVPYVDHNDGDDIMSQDTVEAPTQPYTILRRQQNAAIAAARNVQQDAAIAAAHNVHAVNEDSSAYGIRRYYKDDPYQHSRSDGMAHDVSAVNENLHDSMTRKYYKDDPRQSNGTTEAMTLPSRPTISRRQPSLLPYSGPSGVMPVQRIAQSMPRPFPRTTYENPPSPVERHYLRVSPTAMYHGSPADVEANRLYRLRHPWPSATGQVFTPYRVTNWNDIYCPDDQKRATSARVAAFQRFEAQLPHAALHHNRQSPIPMPRLSAQPSNAPDDDAVPDLLDPDESGDESLPSSLNINSNTIFQENRLSSVQPSVAVPDTFQHKFDVPTGQHLSNEVLPSVNPSSSNIFTSQINSTKSPDQSSVYGF